MTVDQGKQRMLVGKSNHRLMNMVPVMFSVF